jgi:photosystem II stability/assembly factor-like uncharacterized protein
VNRGRSWQQRTPRRPCSTSPSAPGEPGPLVAVTQTGLLSSTDTGRTWRPLRGGLTGRLAWPTADALYLAAPAGTVSRSTDGGRRFQRVGTVQDEPEAFAANGPRELYAAVHGGTVLASTGGGRHWRTRTTP